MITENGQNIFDVAIGEYGSAEAVFAFMNDNPSVTSLNAVIVPGTKYKITSAPVDADVLNYLKAKKITCATGADTDAPELLLNIDDMILQNVDGSDLHNG